MKKNILLLAIFSLSVTFLFAQPKIEISGNGIKDWGKVSKKDGPLKTQFKIYNKGNKLLKIHSVKPTCGCTTAPLDKTEIKPGEFATMNVELQISKDEGKVTKYVSITSNDPNEDKKDIQLKAKILVPFSFFPAKNLMFGNIYPKKENVAKIVLTNNLDNEIKINSIKVEPSFIKVNLKAGDKLKPGQDFPLTCSFKNVKIGGRFEGNLIIRTSDPEMPIIELPILGTIIPD